MSNKFGSKDDVQRITPVLALLTVALKANGIGRTTGWKLAKLKLIETVCIGRRRYAVLSSFDTLPQRLAALKGGEV